MALQKCSLTSLSFLKFSVPSLQYLSTNTTRSLSLSASQCGQKNFRKFHLGNKRGTRIFKRRRNEGKYEDFPIETEVKKVGYRYNAQFITIPEMIPEIIVPDLTDCQLKPYVSYRAPDVYQTEFTTEDLFDAVYKGKIAKDFLSDKLDSDGNSLEPSDEEKLIAEEAYIAARKVGNDIFSERIPKRWECLEPPSVKIVNPKECE